MVGIFAIKQPVTLELVKTLQIIWMTGIVSCGSLRKPDSSGAEETLLSHSLAK
jgi:hypothetical protein